MKRPNRRRVISLARFLEIILVSCVAIMASVNRSEARVQPIIAISTKTINTPKRQAITVATHVLLTASQTEAHVDENLLTASAALQTKDSDADIICPIKFVRSGTVRTFGTSDDIELFDINTEGKYVLLRTTSSLQGIRVKIPGAVRWCAGKTGNYTGCADQPGTHLLLDPHWLGTDLAHEFGHNQGIAGLRGTEYAHRLMSDDAPAEGVVPNEVTTEECRALQQ